VHISQTGKAAAGLSCERPSENEQLGGQLSFPDNEVATSTQVPPESAEDYGRIVVRLNPRWRVTVCRQGIQWILQYRSRAETVPNGDWRGRSYCRTSEALRRCSREYAGSIDPAAAATMAALREQIELLTPPDGGENAL
jgi:hypothetical protein